MKDRKKVLILSFLTFLGFALRLGAVSYGNFAFTFDVGRDLLAVQKIVSQKRPTLLGPTSGIPGFFYTSWWYYFLLPSFIISSGSPFGVVLSIVLLGSLMVPLSFLLGKLVGDERLGLIFSSLVSVSPYLISASTQIWSPNLVPFLTLLVFIFYFFLTQGKLWPSFFLGFFLGLIFESEMGFGFLFIPSTLVTLFFARKVIRNWKKVIFFVLLGLCFVELPRLLFELRHNFLQTRSLLRFFQLGQEELSLSPHFERLFYLYHVWISSVAGKNNFLGLVLALFTFFSLFCQLKTKWKYLISLSLLTTFLFFLEIVFWPKDFWGHYLIGLGLIFVFLVSLTFNFWKRSLPFVFLLFLFNLNFPSAIKFFQPPSWEGDAAVFRNQIAVVDYVYQQARGEKFNYIAYTPPLIDYTWQYLFSWYGKRKYGYPPSQSTQRLFFVILEPDYQMPERREIWLEQRKGDGRIVKREIVKGGIEVETRVR